VKTAPPLRLSPFQLAAWSDRVAVAQRSTYATILIDPSLVLAIAQELEILRSSNDFLRSQREGERTSG
jgi:hypothetical protein